MTELFPNIFRARDWAIGKALPLWSGAGFDPVAALFHERLDFDGRPLALPRRLMVQARQVATFARCHLAGWHHPAFELADTMAEVERRFHNADGAAGWIFAIAPDGTPANNVRDLYGHAFLLYALAWTHRLTGDPHWVALADVTLSEMDAIFAADHGGFRDQIPATDSIRRQNPHMHLLEALLALFEATVQERYLVRAAALVDLARRHFMPSEGVLLEEFDIEWRPGTILGENRVEPGHLFEWAWLLQEFSRLSGDPLAPEAELLVGFAIRHGLDRERSLFVDAVTDTGRPMLETFRAWPQSEAVKAFAVAGERGSAEALAMADLWTGRMLDVFAPPALEGGWIDRVDRDGQPLVDHMPASTLYHLVGAILEADRVAGLLDASPLA